MSNNYILDFFPKYAAKHKGFLPSLKNCLNRPSAADPLLLLAVSATFSTAAGGLLPAAWFPSFS